jgi:hypothetical protein
MANWANWTPVRLTAVGSNAATASAWLGGRVTRSRQYSAPNPTIRTTVTSNDQALEGSERSLVHSERATRAWLTRWAAGWVVVMAVLLRSWGRGTRPRPGSGR